MEKLKLILKQLKLITNIMYTKTKINTKTKTKTKINFYLVLKLNYN